MREVFMRIKDPETIKEARLSKGYTQRNLADLSRCSQAAIWQIENGVLTSVSEDLAQQLCKWLGLTGRALFIRGEIRTHAVTTGARRTRQSAAA
jgi:transcriptional regulator with XRE-family HTH domain